MGGVDPKQWARLGYVGRFWSVAVVRLLLVSFCGFDRCYYWEILSGRIGKRKRLPAKICLPKVPELSPTGLRRKKGEKMENVRMGPLP